MSRAPQKTRIYILAGPTASGKSAVGLEAAERMGAEIVSIDSMQVYRGMDIGTAKPGAADRERVPHHLIDVRAPWESFSTADYIALADEAVREITARGRRALFVGGTALYIQSLLAGIFEGPSADLALRGRLREEAARVGVEALHARLAEVDPEAAARIHPNDMRRIERALEIYEKTGTAPSALRREWSSGETRYDAALAGIDWPRAALRARIDARVDAMLAAGWLEEAKALLADPRGLGREASQALGYRELAEVARGEAALADAVERIKARTRQFAKRQMTWFRRFEDVTWLAPARNAVEMTPRDMSELADAVVACFDDSNER